MRTRRWSYGTCAAQPQWPNNATDHLWCNGLIVPSMESLHRFRLPANTFESAGHIPTPSLHGIQTVFDIASKCGRTHSYNEVIRYMSYELFFCISIICRNKPRATNLPYVNLYGVQIGKLWHRPMPIKPSYGTKIEQSRLTGCSWTSKKSTLPQTQTNKLRWMRMRCSETSIVMAAQL